MNHPLDRSQRLQINEKKELARQKRSESKVRRLREELKEKEANDELREVIRG